ncbi:unnamed protein product [Notodromas monacha]|uniref:RING-type E3 ubiquitin transferase n=1 Tax=Notodromas monacha TaxID=399045 RepID=A0A7R9BSA3_9CRUS|nr:unnamed protein product [Notodromas monacha]CAG0919384.1 unnamed protein product [Notodromas monacha]
MKPVAVLKVSMKSALCVTSVLTILLLQTLEEKLLCGICHGPFVTAMMTPCSHNYCSLCIRKHLSKSSRCPICQQDIVVRELRNNRLLDELLADISSLNQPAIPVVENVEVSTVQDKHTSAEKRLNQPKNPEKCPTAAVPSTSTAPNDSLSQSPTAMQQKVACPVCSKMMAEKNINIHLDRCLSGSPSRSKTAANAESSACAFSLLRRQQSPKKKPQSLNSVAKRRPMAKLVYSIMSEKELRKQCRKIGLSDKGSKQILQDRHQKFVLLYNADCDRLNPTPVEELIKRVEEDERDLVNAASVPGTSASAAQSSRIFSVDRTNSDPRSIERERIEYLKKHNHHFNSLIEEARNRMEVAAKKAVKEVEEQEPRRSSFKKPDSANQSRTSKEGLRVQFAGEPQIVAYSNDTPSSEKFYIPESDDDTGSDLFICDNSNEEKNMTLHDIEDMSPSPVLVPMESKSILTSDLSSKMINLTKILTPDENSLPCYQMPPSSLPSEDALDDSSLMPVISIQLEETCDETNDEPVSKNLKRRRHNVGPRAKQAKKQGKPLLEEVSDVRSDEVDDDFVSPCPPVKRSKVSRQKKEVTKKKETNEERVLREAFENVGPDVFENSMSSSRPKRSTRKVNV